MKYTVVRPWFGVAAGTVIERDNLHPSLKAHVTPFLEAKNEAVLEVATPGAKSGGKKLAETQKDSDEGKRKGLIAKALKDAGIKFDGRLSADELGQLLPEGKLAELFPAE